MYSISILKLQDCITIREAEVGRLDKFKYLNDNLIDLQIKLDIAESELKDQVYAFSCLFIPKLTEQKSYNYSLVARWTNKVNLWSKDFVFIPINEDIHWSLITVVRPGLCLSSDPINDDDHQPCLLVMDSLGMHDPVKFSKIIKNYLVDEYGARSSIGGTMKHTHGELEEISKRIRAMKYYRVPLPRQRNGYDCGVYVIKYLRYVLEINPSSKQRDITLNFKNSFNQNRFIQEDIDAEREAIRHTIYP